MSFQLHPFPPHAFPAHIGLLRLFLTHRTAIVERIEAVLNAQRTPARYLQGRSFLSNQLEQCFFDPAQKSPAFVFILILL